MRLATLAASAGIILLCHVPVFAQASPPAAPVVTSGADLKHFTLDWDPVPGADVYWVLEKKTAGSPFVRIGDPIPEGRTRASVFVATHLFNWDVTRYAVAACNAAGCTRSSPIDPRPLMLDTIGYFKASNTEPVTLPGAEDNFGVDMAMSSDGRTLAVAAQGESSSASGVNGDQLNNDSHFSGAVYVFRREGRRWRQEAYLKDLVNASQMMFGRGSGNAMRGLAISGDGSWLAAGGQFETVGGVEQAGRVYLFHRDTSGSWSLHTVLTAPQPGQYQLFGYSLNMSENGALLKVSVNLPATETEARSSEIHFFERDGMTWQHAGMLPTFFDDYDCGQSGMSGDGLTLIAACHSEVLLPNDRMVTLKRMGGAWVRVHEMPLVPANVLQPVAMDHHATRMALIEAFSHPTVVLHRWEGGAWVREAELPAPAIEEGEGTVWGLPVQFSRNGRIVALPDLFSRIAGVGVMKAYSRGATASGAVLVYQRAGDEARWRLRSVLKAPNAEEGQEDGFGVSLALSGNGRHLAIGALWEDSNARGIDGDRSNNDSSNAGAVFLY
jgi:hypothetical protein